MGLDNFETDGPRTRSQNNTQQTDLEGGRVTEFEEEWGMKKAEAEQDIDFIVDRVEEGWSSQEICELLDCLEYTLFDRYIEAVKADKLKISDVPDINHPAFDDQHAKYYVKSAIKHNRLDAIAEEGTKSTTEGSVTDSTIDKSSGLDSFRT